MNPGVEKRSAVQPDGVTTAVSGPGAAIANENKFSVDAMSLVTWYE
jgi:hypothetical protein